GPLVDAGTCTASWCGCGECNPVDIVCSHESHPCGRQCLQSCPALAQATCVAVGFGCAGGGVDSPQNGWYTRAGCPPGKDRCGLNGAPGGDVLGHCGPLLPEGC